MISVAILKKPTKNKGTIVKGAIILSKCDKTCELIPKLKEYYYLIERRGWEGMNDQKAADIKLVEDSRTLEETRKIFPEAILLDLAGGDFVDTEKFKPLNLKKEYTGIHISSWQRFKRHKLFVEGVSLLPEKKFIKFGHFPDGGSKEENELRRDILNLSKKLGANIEYLSNYLANNEGLPSESEEINILINKSKMGILTTKVEGLNRFKMECLAANIPVLVPKDASEPTKKYINDKTGVLFEPTPEGLAKAIEYVESNYSQFFPRDYLLSNTGVHNSLKKLKDVLNKLVEKEESKQNFDDIYWDGRNQGMLWGKKAIEEIKKTIKEVNLS